MKVGVITRHAVLNYGSLLQTIATQQVIENLGHECQIIDYIREDESYRKCEYTMLAQKQNWQKPIKKLIYLLIRQPNSIIAGKWFESERKKRLKLTKRYTDLESLYEEPPIADVYMTGSDQVWGPVGNGVHDSAYCLPFAKGKKISFSASFGRASMKDEQKEFYKKHLLSYEHIAVREQSAVELLHEMGLESKRVLDPTLLLDGVYWNQFTSPPNIGRYILIYQIHNDSALGEYAKKVAKAKGAKLIRLSASVHHLFRAGRLKWKPELGEFLSYIKYADCLITDSFHGTAFAINFNTPFVVVLPDIDTSTRIRCILEMTGLESRILKDKENISLSEVPVDFSCANAILPKEREKSLELLGNMIEQ